MPATTLDIYRQILIEIDDIRTRMETMRAAGNLTDRDIETVYESLFLRAVVGFEQFCETQFFDILHGNVRYSAADNVERHIKSCGDAALRAIVMQDDDYLDWIPYGKSEGRSKLFFKDGRPFTNLDDGDKSKIQRIVTIRHAIAHPSEHARVKFERIAIGSTPLLPHERTPSGFLRSQISALPARSRFENFIAELGAIAAKIYGTPRWHRRAP